MNLHAKRLRRVFDIPAGAFSGPHLQRLAERWLRRWVYALSGAALGLWAGGLMWPEASERHAQALQAVSRLQAQLAALPEARPGRPENPLPTEVQNRLARLPAQTLHGQVWADWHQVLQDHGLRLQSLRPLPPMSITSPTSPNTVSVGHSGLPSQVAAVQVRGRFEDWTRLWAACTELGPVCSIDRISVVATEPPAEVQIDAVLRLWMRPDAQDVDRDSAQAWPEQAAWTVPSESGQGTSARAHVALFSLANAGAATLATSADAGVPAGVLAEHSTAAAVATVPGAAATAELSADPRQWPLAHVRWLGLWQQGADRLAILSAGAHWAKVTLGQRVTLEGHRVEAISEDGVRVRLAGGPLLKLDGLEPSGDRKPGKGDPR